MDLFPDQTMNIQKENTQTAAIKDSLEFFPVALFGSTVAIAGLSIAFKQASVLFGLPPIAAQSIGVLAWILFIFLTILYLVKIFRFPVSVKAELTHPVSANFLGTFFISAVLLSSIAIPFSLDLARITWISGTTGGSIFMFVLTYRLFKGELNVLDAVPPTLIPGLTVLNAVTAGVGMKLGIIENETGTILFSLGIVYVMVFFVIIAYRLVHREPIRIFLKPTLLLMSAPFTVGFLSYVSQVKHVDLFGSVLFYFGFFIFIVLFFIVFTKGLPFMISWWGACFSTGALTNASLRYAILSQDLMVKGLAGFMLAAASVLILSTFLLTLRLQLNGKLLKP